MAFTIANFQPVGGQSKRGVSPAVWSYATLDAHATVDESAYFNSIASLLSVGDIIHVVVWSTAIGTGGTISTYGTHIVNSIASGVVDVSNVTVGTVTDSD
ncbi:MAG: hypothetical protein HGA87_01445 [Desulfobulbaceae bacterium]|nr:hypothetical protein [Desulfobulbaceae bacterium]